MARRDAYVVDEMLSESHSLTVYRSHDAQGRPILVKKREFADDSVIPLILQRRQGIIGLTHPQICTVRSITRNGNYLTVVSDHESRSLIQQIEQRMTRQPNAWYSEAEMRQMLFEVSNVLAFLHEQGIGHRTIDPRNVFVTDDGKYKLGDLSGLEFRYPSDTVDSALVFMCPELKSAVAMGEPDWESKFDAKKGDVFSLAITLLNMGTLNVPLDFKSMNKHHQTVDRKCGDLRTKGCSDGFVDVVRGMLERHEKDRFDVHDLMEALTPGSLHTPIAALCPRHLHLFHPLRNAWTAVDVKCVNLQVDQNTAYAVLTNDSIFACCGGRYPRKSHADNKAYAVSLTGETQQLDSLRVGRLRPGLAYSAESMTVFAFGGCTAYNHVFKTGAKLSFPQPANLRSAGRSEEVWSAISDVTPRVDFTPCVCAGSIYLAGGGHPSIDVFNPITCISTPLQVNGLDPDLTISLAAAQGSQLILIGNTHFYRINTGTSCVIEQRPRNAGQVKSAVAPIAWRSGLFVVSVEDAGFVVSKLEASTGNVAHEYRVNG